ncbi:MAG: hypothetical protein IKT58_00255 [Oscillospiraceae bacterium]|nr:hypothetical protein [Oscillospiraceae bacterium]
MKGLSTKVKEKRLPLILTLFLWLLSFYTEGFYFTVARGSHLLTYCACKVVLFLGVFLFLEFLIRAIRTPEDPSRVILAYSGIYLILLLGWLFKMMPHTLQGDELNIYNHGKELDAMAYWFNYFTGYYWISCSMLFPFQLGAVFVKVVLHALVIGYCTYRLSKAASPRAALLLFLPYLQPFVLDLGCSAHRLPIYGILYLFLGAKLFFDHKEGKSMDRKTLVLLSVVIAILSFWRTEGLYLTVAGPILVLVAYRVPVKGQLSRLWKPALCYFLILVLVALPQLAAYMDKNKPSVIVRSEPLCGYALANMLRNGLEEGDIPPEEYAAIDRYISFRDLEEFNQTNGDRAYAHAMVMSLASGDADFEVREAFCDAVKSLILRHPFIYLRSQWNSFRYTSSQYDYLRGKTEYLRYFSYRQWIPLILCLCFLVYGLLRKKYVTLLLSLCAVGNWALVTALMPAAYAKYFYVDYLLGYFFLFVGLAMLLSGKRKNCYE